MFGFVIVPISLNPYFRPNDENYGRAVAIVILSCVNAFAFTSQSILQVRYPLIKTGILEHNLQVELRSSNFEFSA